MLSACIILACALLTTALPATHHRTKHTSNNAAAAITNAKAVYFIDNLSGGNSVIALNVAADGTLSNGTVTATGGNGGSGLDASGQPASPDALASQGSVKAVDNVLIAVNAGSNTMSMFIIDNIDATKLVMVGQPVSTLGEFPTSVDISTKLMMACVANTGKVAGVACFSMSTTSGLTALDTAVRPFAINQTTPPTVPLNTVSQVFFNTDSTVLLTTVKGDPTVNNTGFLSSFAISNGTVSTSEIRSSPAGTAVLFGVTLLPNSKKIFVTDASFGSATLSVSANNTAAISAQTKIADQSATCWATFSPATKTAFVTDVAVNHLVEINTSNGKIITETSFAGLNANPGMIDLAAAGNFIYALSPGNATTPAAVAVVDVSGGSGSAKLVQNFALTGVTAAAQGMTFI